MLAGVRATLPPTAGRLISQDTQARHWATASADEVLASCGTRRGGLSPHEAAERLARHGPNVLARMPKRPWYWELGENFVHLFAVLLWCGAVLAWLAGMPQLALAIVAVVLINGAFSYAQQYQAERAVEALAALLPRRVVVRRAEHLASVAADDLVPGDILVLSEGEAVAADARLISAAGLRLDTSSLTGESRPVPRHARSVEVRDRTPAELANLVLAGTSVTGGSGEAVVFATGGATEFGRIAQLTQVEHDRPSPLKQEIGRITRLITVLAVTTGVVFFLAGTAWGGLSLVAGFLFAVGIIVANVPEGLLPTITLSLAIAVRRMAGRRAIVKRLEKVETLGATTVILTDKTGTLTENEMTVRALWTGGSHYRFSGLGFQLGGSVERVGELAGDPQALTETLRAAALCCDARLSSDRHQHCRVIGDPTEAAILVAAAKAGLAPEMLDRWPRLSELPFDSTRKRMTTIEQIDGRAVACVKGAPSQMLPLCTRIRWGDGARPLDEQLREAAQQVHDVLARRGLRVLAVATREVGPALGGDNHWRVEDVERDLTLLGFLAMEDPPRAEVPAAIAACRQAGVRVIMITGDNGLTAAAIGREIGLHAQPPRIVSGADLDVLDDARLGQLLVEPELLFARVTPEHKLRLVRAFQNRGEVVAVTGDGVNDAPALKRADIGVAMGVVGTDVAREAADMVLADDNFASIVAAIEEGRAVYDNARKFVTYIFASNIPEVVPFIAFVLFRIPLPLTVMQILAVDLGTDMLPAVALGAERPEPDVMRRPPRPRSQRLLDTPTLLRAYGWLGLIEAALGLVGYFYAYWLAGWRPGQAMAASGTTYATATTMSLAGIVACQVGNALACRSNRRPVWRLGLMSNRLLLAGIGAEIVLLAALIYVPSLAAVFGLAPLGPWHWLLLATFAPALLILEECRKAVVWRLALSNSEGARATKQPPRAAGHA